MKVLIIIILLAVSFSCFGKNKNCPSYLTILRVLKSALSYTDDGIYHTVNSFNYTEIGQAEAIVEHLKKKNSDHMFIYETIKNIKNNCK